MSEVAAQAATKPRILSFCRPYLTADFCANLAPVSAEFEIAFLTDGRSPGTPDTRAQFYDNLRHERRCAELDAAAQADVMARCRLLRNLPPATATGLMHAMAVTLAAELDRFQPDVVLCHMVDEYVTHLLAILAARRGVPFIGYAHSYFPGLLQITQHAHGRPVEARAVPDEEVARVLETIRQRTFRQNYQQRPTYSLRRHLWGLLRYRIKLAAFGVKSVLERDPWNMHYSITPYVVERRRLRDFPRPSDFAADWAADLRALQAGSGKRVLYVPLAYFPESTLDYWILDKRILRYEAVTLEMLRTLARDFIVVAKEHLHMMGARDVAFYAALRAIPGVVSVHPLEYSNDVLAAADAVLLGAGSVGVEATLRDKPVFSYSDSSYWFAASRATFLRLDEIERWSSRIAQVLGAYRPLDERAKREFLRTCLSSTVRPRAGGRRWPLIEIEDLRALLRIALSRTDEARGPAVPRVTSARVGA
ncbi:MAG TPA: hypothetical protein VH814_07590 [Steroidobacteraceae bacterium]|jgi:hypothetical protein